MAAEVLSSAGLQVDLYDAMPSVGRKFLLAGKGGLNLTHSEALPAFVGRYGSRRDAIAPMLNRFGPDDLRAWAAGLGFTTFVGSSGRVFPSDLKAAPLLRAWLHRLRVAGVRFHMRHRWTGWGTAEAAKQALVFDAPQGEVTVPAEAVLLALGSGSWARLGSDGAWVPLLAQRGVDVAPLVPSNCGFDVARVAHAGDASLGSAADSPTGWSDHFRTRFAGQPMKNVAISMLGQTGDLEGAGVEATGDADADADADAAGIVFHQAGEFVVTGTGVEGSLVYAASSFARDAIAARGKAVIHIDLLPARSAEFVREEVARPRGSRSLSTHLKSRLGIDGVKAGLLHELLPREAFLDPSRLALAIKSLPLTLAAARPIDEAISSGGGVRFEALNEGLMLRELPGVFCAGEMLDWEAPTGGYLLTACMASGLVAANGLIAHLAAPQAEATR
ncbi:TIGR03862 family flavoprotein [soil metagenome]